jgi:hypothetical protein
MTNSIAAVGVEAPYASSATLPGAAFVGAFMALGLMLVCAACRLQPCRRENHARYTTARRRL